MSNGGNNDPRDPKDPNKSDLLKRIEDGPPLGMMYDEDGDLVMQPIGEPIVVDENFDPSHLGEPSDDLDNIDDLDDYDHL
jgi:hypothetical protein